MAEGPPGRPKVAKPPMHHRNTSNALAGTFNAVPGDSGGLCLVGSGR